MAKVGSTQWYKDMAVKINAELLQCADIMFPIIQKRIDRSIIERAERFVSSSPFYMGIDPYDNQFPIRTENHLNVFYNKPLAQRQGRVVYSVPISECDSIITTKQMPIDEILRQYPVTMDDVYKSNHLESSRGKTMRDYYFNQAMEKLNNEQI